MRALRSLKSLLPLSHSGGAESLEERSQNGRSQSEISGGRAAGAVGLAFSALSAASWASFPLSRVPRSTRSLATISVRHFFSALCPSSQLVVWSLPSIYRCEPLATNSPTLGKFPPHHNVVPFGAVLEFASLVLESFVGSQTESSNRNAARRVFDFRVFSD